MPLEDLGRTWWLPQPEPADGLCLPRRDPDEGPPPFNQSDEAATLQLPAAQPHADELSPPAAATPIAAMFAAMLGPPGPPRLPAPIRRASPGDRQFRVKAVRLVPDESVSLGELAAVESALAGR
jgi:hypothetical protein